MLLAGCSDNNIARKYSDLREEIARYAQGPEDRATEISIEQKILKNLPLGSAEAEVCESIRENYRGKVPDAEKGVPPWNKWDYFYRIHAWRNRVEIWYFIKDGKLVRVKVAYVRAFP